VKSVEVDGGVINFNLSFPLTTRDRLEPRLAPYSERNFY